MVESQPSERDDVAEDDPRDQDPDRKPQNAANERKHGSGRSIEPERGEAIEFFETR